MASCPFTHVQPSSAVVPPRFQQGPLTTALQLGPARVPGGQLERTRLQCDLAARQSAIAPDDSARP